MMKLYKIKVNGKIFEVEVESVTETKSVAEPSIKASVSEDQTHILAPIQGTVIQSNVSTGTKVEKGSVLLVLESMKLENEILSPVTGSIKLMFVTVGQKVELNQLMLVIG